MLTTQASLDSLINSAANSDGSDQKTIDGEELVPIINMGTNATIVGYICWGGAVILGGVASALYPFMDDEKDIFDLDE